MVGGKMKKKNRIKQSKTDKIFDIFNKIFLTIILLLIILPLLNLLALAFSKGIYNPEITFFPKGITLEAIKFVINESGFLIALKNSIVITLIVTILSNLLMALAAYPLSKPDCPFRKGLLLFFVVTMLFSPG